MELAFNKEIILNKTACRVIGVATFIVLTSLGAFVRIPLPFTPVPLTLQTFFVLLSGAFLGGTFGAASQLGYVFLGLAGLPVFTGSGSGGLYFLGPTGGYLVGFILAALFVGRLIKYAKRNLFTVLAILIMADLIILLSGSIWLKLTLGLSFKKVLLLGFVPFLPGDLLKAIIASALYLKLRSRLKEVF